MTNDQGRTTINDLNQRRIALVLWIVSNAYLRSRGIPKRIAALLVVQQLGRFEIDTIQCVKIKNDLVAASGCFRIDYSAVADPTVSHEVGTALGEMISFLLTLEET